jgi:hypothetical protein
MKISLVIETWNLGTRIEPALTALVDRLRAQSVAPAELVVTHADLPAEARARVDRIAGRAITWVRPGRTADYYAHKNAGFDATTGEIVAFIDGDCTPGPRWLERLVAPIRAGEAKVAAGRTRYPAGPAAIAGTAVDFPLFPSPLARGAVRNFFANNVAFARDVFAARRYPELPEMFHGQCQVLALRLQAEGVIVRLSEGAVLEHAWPDGIAESLTMRLLRGADTRAFAPHLAHAYAPRLEAHVDRLGAIPALAVLALRAARATRDLVRARPGAIPLAAGLGFVLAASAIDGAGAIAARRITRARRRRT